MNQAELSFKKGKKPALLDIEADVFYGFDIIVRLLKICYFNDVVHNVSPYVRLVSIHNSIHFEKVKGCIADRRLVCLYKNKNPK